MRTTKAMLLALILVACSAHGQRVEPELRDEAWAGRLYSGISTANAILHWQERQGCPLHIIVMHEDRLYDIGRRAVLSMARSEADRRAARDELQSWARSVIAACGEERR